MLTTWQSLPSFQAGNQALTPLHVSLMATGPTGLQTPGASGCLLTCGRLALVAEKFSEKISWCKPPGVKEEGHLGGAREVNVPLESQAPSAPA